MTVVTQSYNEFNYKVETFRRLCLFNVILQQMGVKSLLLYASISTLNIFEELNNKKLKTKVFE